MHLNTPAALPAPPSPAIPAILTRRELFCQHMAAGAGGAEAARRAGYSPCGAKQRACHLMRQPEIRLRIDALRAERRAERQLALTEAIAVVDQIIDGALGQAKGALALRALDYKLKLKGIIQDQRIDFHGYGKASPDAGLEDAAQPPHQDLDGLPGHVGLPLLHDFVEAGFVKDGRFAAPVPEDGIVTFDDPDADFPDDPDDLNDPDDLTAAAPAASDATADAALAVTSQGTEPRPQPHPPKRMTFDDRRGDFHGNHPATASMVIPGRPQVLVPLMKPSRRNDNGCTK